ncbi:hypothetical protein Efla_006849 [Eimeria flavescens]
MRVSLLGRSARHVTFSSSLAPSDNLVSGAGGPSSQEGYSRLAENAMDFHLDALQKSSINAAPEVSRPRRRPLEEVFASKLRRVLRQERMCARRARLQCQLLQTPRKHKQDDVVHNHSLIRERSARGQQKGQQPVACLCSSSQPFRPCLSSPSPCCHRVIHTKLEGSQSQIEGHQPRGQEKVGSIAGVSLTPTCSSRKHCVRSLHHGLPPSSSHRFGRHISSSIHAAVKSARDTSLGSYLVIPDSSSEDDRSKSQIPRSFNKQEEATREVAVSLGGNKNREQSEELVALCRSEVPPSELKACAERNPGVGPHNRGLQHSSFASRATEQQYCSCERPSGMCHVRKRRRKPGCQRRGRMPAQHAGEPQRREAARKRKQPLLLRKQSKNSRPPTAVRRHRVSGTQSANPHRTMPHDTASSCKPSVDDWPDDIKDMLATEIFDRLKKEPELVLRRSEGSGMSMFHHMLRHPEEHDQQMLGLFKLIYEDKWLNEKVTLPSLIELKCDSGQTLAFYAANYGHVNCLRWILEQVGGPEEQKCYLLKRDPLGDTALHHAVKQGHIAVAELLLSRAPELINQPRNNGCTPIFDAFDNPKVVRLLLQSVRCKEGLTPLKAAKLACEWNRQCADRSQKGRQLLHRLGATVAALRQAEQAATTGGMEQLSANQSTQVDEDTSFQPCASSEGLESLMRTRPSQALEYTPG